MDAITSTNTVVELLDQLERLRVEARLSIEQAAELVGVSPLTYKRWRYKQSIPTVQETAIRASVEVMDTFIAVGKLPASTRQQKAEAFVWMKRLMEGGNA